MARGGIVTALDETGKEIVLKSVDGQLYVVGGPNTYTKKKLEDAPFGTASSGDTTIITGVANKKIRVHQGIIHAATATDFHFKSEDGSVIYGNATNEPKIGSTSDAGGFIIPPSDDGWFETKSGQGLVINLGSAVAVSGILNYTLVDPGVEEE